MNTPDPETDLDKAIHKARKKHPFVRLIFPILCIGGIALAILWWRGRSEKQNDRPEYATAPVEKGSVSLTITTTGSLEPTNQITIGSELSGTVREVLVDSNDAVKEGQALAKLDPTKLLQTTERSRALLDSAKARVNQAKATVKESEANLARLTGLHRISGGRTPSKAEMETAIATVDRAKADLESANAAVSEAAAQVKANESDLSKTTIRSPVNGVVLTRSVEPGQTVAAQFQAPVLFLIAEDLRRMDLKVNIAEADIGRVANGQKATFTVDAWPDRKFSGSVKKVAFGSVITDNVVTFPTELEVRNDDLSLRPGMTATADIAVAGAENVLLVPNTALRFDPARAAAAGKKQAAPKKSFIDSLSGRPGGGRRWGAPAPKTPAEKPGAEKQVHVLRDGEPVPIPVTPGVSDGRNTEISGPGISEGMEVIISRNAPAEP